MSISTPVDKTLADAFLVKFQSREHLRDWIDTYLNIRFPDSTIDPVSTSNPIDAMYRAYSDFRDDKCLEVPGYIWLSGRDLGKTLCGSILNMILMLHFQTGVAHFAAIKDQAEKSLQYVRGFLKKLAPYLEYHGKKVVGDAASKIQIQNADETINYIRVIVATAAGSNSEHLPVATFDELDVLSPVGLKAYKEAKLIGTRMNGMGPLSIKYSTRKFAGGIFEKEIQDAENTGEIVLSWNIIDATEYCSPERHKPELPKVKMHINTSLPLRQKSEDDFNHLHPDEQKEYVPVNAHAGCVGCLLLPVCKTRLADRSPDDVGGFFKSIPHTIRQFKITEPSIAESQLLCWKAAQEGLIYGKFLPKEDGTGNIYTIARAYETFTGEAAPKHISYDFLLAAMKRAGVKFYAGVDWGYTAKYVIVIAAKLANGDFWIMDCYAQSGLEWDQQLAQAKKFRDKYRPAMWFCDTAYPANLKTFTKNQMPTKKFTKDIMAGIDAIRTQIVDAADTRRLRVIKHANTDQVIKMFQNHHFTQDVLGNPTTEEASNEYTDIGDAMRYLGQNLYAPKGGGLKQNVDPASYGMGPVPEDTYENWRDQVIAAAKTQDEVDAGGSETSGLSTSGSVFWDFGGSDDIKEDGETTLEDGSVFKFKTEEELMEEFKANAPKPSDT